MKYVVWSIQFKLQLKARESRLKNSSVHYQIEPQSGVPFARNLVLDIAEELGCDFLAFTDDDCQVSSGWITQLLEAQQKHAADLVTNSVRYTVQFDELNFLQRSIARGLLQKYAMRGIDQLRKNKRPSSTNNWMVNMNFVRIHSLRFDPSYSGGGDTKFRMAVQQLAGHVALAPDAYVEEMITHDRLTAGYNFRRAMANQLATSRLKKRPRHIYSILPVFASICQFMYRVPLMFFDGGFSYVRAIRELGKIAGRLCYMLGLDVNQYRNTTGK